MEKRAQKATQKWKLPCRGWMRGARKMLVVVDGRGNSW